MILTIGFMTLKSEKIDALSGAIPTLKEIIWRKKALSPCCQVIRLKIGIEPPESRVVRCHTSNVKLHLIE